jgi:ribosome-associated toxin RatA of RatAB toxin-antitoxin module
VPAVETKIVVDAPARDVYELAKDQERFPAFMPDVESVTIVERHPDRIISRWKTLVEEAPIEWIEEDRFDDAALRVDYKLLEGDLDKFEGTWRLRTATAARTSRSSSNTISAYRPWPN